MTLFLTKNHKDVRNQAALLSVFGDNVVLDQVTASYNIDLLAVMSKYDFLIECGDFYRKLIDVQYDYQNGKTIIILEEHTLYSDHYEYTIPPVFCKTKIVMDNMDVYLDYWKVVEKP